MAGIVYDAPPILGFGEASDEPLPDPIPGEVVIRVGAWSLKDLCAACTNLKVGAQYDRYDWISAKLIPGIYRVRIPHSNPPFDTFAVQKKHSLLSGEEVAPAALVASVLLCHFQQMGKNLLNDDWVRCVEQTAEDHHVVLGSYGGDRVHVRDLKDDCHDDGLLIAACRELNLAT